MTHSLKPILHLCSRWRHQVTRKRKQTIVSTMATSRKVWKAKTCTLQHVHVQVQHVHPMQSCSSEVGFSASLRFLRLTSVLICLSHFCFSFRFCPKSTGEAPRARLPPRKKSPGSTEYGKSWFGISSSRPAERFQYTSALLRAAVVWGGHASIQKKTQDQKVNRGPCGTWAGKTFEPKAQAVDYWWSLGLEWWRRAFCSPQSGTPSPKCQVSEIAEICD